MSASTLFRCAGSSGAVHHTARCAMCPALAALLPAQVLPLLQQRLDARAAEWHEARAQEVWDDLIRQEEAEKAKGSKAASKAPAKDKAQSRAPQAVASTPAQSADKVDGKQAGAGAVVKLKAGKSGGKVGASGRSSVDEAGAAFGSQAPAVSTADGALAQPSSQPSDASTSTFAMLSSMPQSPRAQAASTTQQPVAPGAEVAAHGGGSGSSGMPDAQALSSIAADASKQPRMNGGGAESLKGENSTARKKSGGSASEAAPTRAAGAPQGSNGKPAAPTGRKAAGTTPPSHAATAQSSTLPAQAQVQAQAAAGEAPSVSAPTCTASASTSGTSTTQAPAHKPPSKPPQPRAPSPPRVYGGLVPMQAPGRPPPPPASQAAAQCGAQPPYDGARAVSSHTSSTDSSTAEITANGNAGVRAGSEKGTKKATKQQPVIVAAPAPLAAVAAAAALPIVTPAPGPAVYEPPLTGPSAPTAPVPPAMPPPSSTGQGGAAPSPSSSMHPPGAYASPLQPPTTTGTAAGQAQDFSYFASFHTTHSAPSTSAQQQPQQLQRPPLAAPHSLPGPSHQQATGLLGQGLLSGLPLSPLPLMATSHMPPLHPHSSAPLHGRQSGDQLLDEAQGAADASDAAALLHMDMSTLPSSIVKHLGLDDDDDDVPRGAKPPAATHISGPGPHMPPAAPHMRPLQVGHPMHGPLQHGPMRPLHMAPGGAAAPAAQQAHQHMRPHHPHQQLPVQPPPHLLCPLTRALMRDPVCAADGYMYERAAIMHWLASSHASPVTGQLLEDTRLMHVVPVALAVRDWCAAAGVQL